MILAALALLAPVITQFVMDPRPDSPTNAEKELLTTVATKCGMHDGAVYFIQYNVPIEPVIHMTHALGDTDAQALCVLQGLPQDFSAKFGLDVEAPRHR